MKCCALPTTSTVPNGRARDVAAQFEGLLFSQAFAPLAKSLGFYGDAVVGSVAVTLARADHSALGERLALTLEGSAAGATL